MVYKLKEEILGVEPARFKGILVTKGYYLREGIDYREVFSPMAKYTSIRTLLAIVTQFDLHLEQMDGKITFLYGELEESIYIKQP